MARGQYHVRNTGILEGVEPTSDVGVEHRPMAPVSTMASIVVAGVPMAIWTYTLGSPRRCCSGGVRAREVARQQGTSLNALVRDFIERIAGQRSGAEIYRELERLWDGGTGRSGGYKFRREDAYKERLGRSRVR